MLESTYSDQLIRSTATVIQISDNACIQAIKNIKNQKNYRLGQFSVRFLLTTALQA